MNQVKRSASLALALLLIVGCCLLFPVRAQADWNFSLSDNINNSIFTSNSYDNGDEALMAGDYATNYKNSPSETEMEALKQEAKPNTVALVKSFAAKDVKKVTVEADLCGILFVPGTGDKVEVSYVGVSDQNLFSVSASASGGELLVKVKGKKKQLLYVSTVEDAVVNTIRISVPAGLLQSIDLTNTTGCSYVKDLDVPVKGSTVNGFIRVTADKVDKDCELSSVNGKVIVRAGTVNGEMDLDTINGTARIEAKTVNGRASLDAINGTASLEADSVKNADISAVNGIARGKIGSIGEKVTAEAINGKVDFELTKKPANLTFKLEADKHSSKVTLPAGWSNGYKAGSGGPVLELGIRNGKLNLAVA